tara:strand:- start:24 stop:710 length:687 start_codon:yes stop_codon:yes gene_type:complete
MTWKSSQLIKGHAFIKSSETVSKSNKLSEKCLITFRILCVWISGTGCQLCLSTIKKYPNGKLTMLIEIGNTYSVYQRTLHTFVEVTIFAHGKDTKVQAESVWRSGRFLVRIEDETEQEHLQTALFIEVENEDPEDFRSDVFTNIEFQDSWNGTIPFLTCVGTGWKDNKQKVEFIQKYKDALGNENESFDSIDDWLSEQGFTDEESMYYIEDGVTVELITGDDELEPIV